MVKLYSAIGWRQLLPFRSAPYVNPERTYSYLKAGCGYCPLRIQLGRYEYQGDLLQPRWRSEPVARMPAHHSKRFVRRPSVPDAWITSLFCRAATNYAASWQNNSPPAYPQRLTVAGLRAQLKPPGDRSTLETRVNLDDMPANLEGQVSSYIANALSIKRQRVAVTKVCILGGQILWGSSRTSDRHVLLLAMAAVG